MLSKSRRRADAPTWHAAGDDRRSQSARPRWQAWSRSQLERGTSGGSARGRRLPSGQTGHADAPAIWLQKDQHTAVMKSIILGRSQSGGYQI